MGSESVSDMVLGIKALQHHVRWLTGDNSAMVDNGNLVTKRLGFLKIMRGQQDGRASIVHVLDVIPKLATQIDVDTCRRFIKDEDWWTVNTLPYQQANVVACRQIMTGYTHLAFSPRPTASRISGRSTFRCRNAKHAGLEFDKFTWREKGDRCSVPEGPHQSPGALGASRFQYRIPISWQSRTFC